MSGSEQRELRDVRDFLSPVGVTDSWLTPPEVLTALGPFDLDPCAPPEWPLPDWPHATRCISRPDDGLSATWAGRVWLNPPYSDTSRWVARLAGHGTGTALIFVRSETGWAFEHVWARASAVLLLEGRLRFIRASGKQMAGHNAPAPSMLVAYGKRDADRLEACGLSGMFTRDWILTGGSAPEQQPILFGGAA